MEYVYIGKYVNTHGIKGEIRIKSNFKYKDKVFNIGNKIYLGNEKSEFIINGYRIHKDYDMVTLKNINNINDIINYKGLNVYIDKSILSGVILDEDLIGFDVIFNNKKVGIIKDFIIDNINNLIVIENDNNKYIPYNKDLIDSIDMKDKKMYIKYIEGLL